MASLSLSLSLSLSFTSSSSLRPSSLFLFVKEEKKKSKGKPWIIEDYDTFKIRFPRCAFASPVRNGSSSSSVRTKGPKREAPAKKRHWKEGEFPTRISDTWRTSTPSKSSSASVRTKGPRREAPAKKRHWKEGEFPGKSDASRTAAPSKSSSSSSVRTRTGPKRESPAKKRIWKEGEFPGISEASLLRPSRTPIKNVKKKVDRRNNAKAWVNTVTEALVDQIQKKQWEGALQVFEMLKEQPFYQPKEGTYMKLLVLLGRSGQPHRASQLFETMVEEECEPTSELYTALLAAYCRSNLLDEAFSVLNKMKTLPRCQPDVYTYSILIKACVDASQFELVDSLYEEMDDRLITPNTVTQNIVLSGYGKAGKYDQMEKVLNGMLESTICKPDVWTMNTILSLFGNKGQIEAMERWYEKFRSYGIEPETRTFNILIGAYGKKRMYDKMSSVMEYMRKLSFPWTTSTYNNVIEVFADVGDAKNMEYTFDQMRTEGMKADSKTFSCLINGYANAGLFHKVLSCVSLAGKLEIPENTSFYNAVISACAKVEDLMEMERVFKHMKDKHCPPNSSTYSIMVEAYRKEGMNDKIFDLEQEKQEIVSNGLEVD